MQSKSDTDSRGGRKKIEYERERGNKNRKGDNRGE